MLRFHCPRQTSNIPTFAFSRKKNIRRKFGTVGHLKSKKRPFRNIPCDIDLEPTIYICILFRMLVSFTEFLFFFVMFFRVILETNNSTTSLNLHIFKINMRQEGPLVVVGCKMSKKIVRIFLHTLITSTYKNFFLSVCNGFANLWCYLCQNEKWSPSMRTICENAFRIHEGKNSRQTECELFMKAPIKINPRFNEL